MADLAALERLVGQLARRADDTDRRLAEVQRGGLIRSSQLTLQTALPAIFRMLFGSGSPPAPGEQEYRPRIELDTRSNRGESNLVSGVDEQPADGFLQHQVMKIYPDGVTNQLHEWLFAGEVLLVGDRDQVEFEVTDVNGASLAIRQEATILVNRGRLLRPGDLSVAWSSGGGMFELSDGGRHLTTREPPDPGTGTPPYPPGDFWVAMTVRV